MLVTSSHTRSLLVVPAVALAAAALSSAAPQDLVDNSPFAPAGSAARQAANAGAPLELRSIMVIDGMPQFSIFDPSTKQGIWIKLRDATQDIVVKNYDAGAESVEVEYQGRPLILALRISKIAAGPAVPVGGISMPSAATSPTPSAALVNTVKTNPTSTEEAARLQAVVEEIRRRRDQRSQTTTSTPGATTPQPQTGAPSQGVRQAPGAANRVN